MSELKQRNPRIVLLTHAPSDLSVLHSAVKLLPAGFPAVIGINLQSLGADITMEQVLAMELESADIIILRILGALGSVPRVAELVRQSRQRGSYLIAISGTGEPDPELAAISSVAPYVLQQALMYFQAGGSINFVQLLHYLSDHLLMTGLGYEMPRGLPDHGIYHPDLAQDATIDEWLKLQNTSHASVGIIFYRAHWLSGNTRFVDALINALEQRGMNVLPIFTSSLRAGNDVAGVLPAGLRYFKGPHGALVDVLINTTSFAMGEITAGGTTPAGWSVAVLEQLNVPVLQAITAEVTCR